MLAWEGPGAMGVRATGYMPKTGCGAMDGTVLELHRKAERPGERGIPKPSTPEVEILENGVGGDFNRYRHERKADDPTSAVLLIPMETIAALRQEGWPVAPGDLGENITTSGIPYAAFRPGTRVRAGQAELEVTRPCDPCEYLYGLPYVGPGRGPSFVRTLLHRRGWYCRVRTPGRVRAGDPIVVTEA